MKNDEIGIDFREVGPSECIVRIYHPVDEDLYWKDGPNSKIVVYTIESPTTINSFMKLIENMKKDLCRDAKNV